MILQDFHEEKDYAVGNDDDDYDDDVGGGNA